MTYVSKTGLMLVDNPKQFFKSLCLLKEKTFTRNEYKQVLASLTRKGKIHDKTRDTYLYNAHIFNLIEEVDAYSHTYKVTRICKKICEVKDIPSEKRVYRQYLRGLLLSNKYKGALFIKFLQFTCMPKKMADIEKEFGKVPTKTLLAFCLEAGLVAKYRQIVKSVEVRSTVSVPEFYSSLVKIYTDLQRDPERRAPIIYVPIDLMRDLVSVDLGLESPVLFDEMLRRILDSKLGNVIYLHGAPPQVISESDSFYYNGKRYTYISMRL